jgi:hypothetical protein
MKPIHELSEQSYFRRLVITISIIYGIISILTAFFFFYGVASENLNWAILQGDDTDMIGAISALVAAIYIGTGTYRYARGKTQTAYKLFENALLINIFVGQVVLFFKSPKVAIAGLAVTLFLLANLKMLGFEEAHRRVRSHGV